MRRYFSPGLGYIRAVSFPIPARRYFSAQSRVYTRGFLSCTRATVLFRTVSGISARFLSLYPRSGTFPHGLGYIRAVSFPVPARRYFSARPRVYTRGFLHCTRAAVFFRPVSGISARFLSLYPRGGIFPPGLGYIRAVFFPVPARQYFSARPRVYTRGFSPCTRAAVLFRTVSGISARFLSLYSCCHLLQCLPYERRRYCVGVRPVIFLKIWPKYAPDENARNSDISVQLYSECSSIRQATFIFSCIT